MIIQCISEKSLLRNVDYLRIQLRQRFGGQVNASVYSNAWWAEVASWRGGVARRLEHRSQEDRGFESTFSVSFGWSVGPFYLVAVPREITHPTYCVNSIRNLSLTHKHKHVLIVCVGWALNYLLPKQALVMEQSARSTLSSRMLALHKASSSSYTSSPCGCIALTNDVDTIMSECFGLRKEP